MRCSILRIILLPTLLTASLWGCASTAPKVSPQKLRILPLQEIDEYSRSIAPEIYLRTTQDILPNGLAAAMAPVLVDWTHSNPFAPNGHYVIRNLNEGGNPVGGTTVLRSARIPAAGIDRVEFILVPLDPLGIKGKIAHGMLRFVFADKSPGRLLRAEGDEIGEGAEIEDIVLSWEAWRSPGVDFDFIKGMDTQYFGLSLRAFTGRQRFLEDVLGERDWHAYTLRLPGGQQGASELLYNTLVLGDGTGRHVMADILSRDIAEWLRQAPGADEDSTTVRARYDDLMQTIRAFDEPKDERLRLSKENRNYQTIYRSCSTMALYCINVATERLLQQGLGEGQGIRPTAPANMESVAPWMTDMAHMTTLEIFLTAPQVVKYLMNNTTVIPTHVPKALKKAGLLANGGKSVHYSLHDTPPYGDLDTILIR